MFAGKLYFAARNSKPFLKDCLMHKDRKASFYCHCATKKATLPC